MSTSTAVSPAHGLGSTSTGTTPSSSAAGTSSTNTTTPTRLKFHDNSAAAARSSIINSSAKGWSPLQINKRDSISSPLKTSTLPSSPDASGPRRTSSSFRHMATNSLVARSPFKDPSTMQGSQAVGRGNDDSPKVIHERRSAGSATTPTRLGQGPSPAKGAPTTPKAAIGLGITANRPRSSSEKDKGSAVSGTRRVSSERKVAFPGSASSERKVSGERRVSGERKVSGSKENDSPDVRSGRRTPRNSSSFKGLAKNELVSRSPFLAGSSSMTGLSASSSRANEDVNPSPKTVPAPRDEDFQPSEYLATPSPRRTSSGKRRASPSSALSAGRMSHSPTPSPPRLFAHPPGGLGSAGPSPLSQATSTAIEAPIVAATPTPTKSSFSVSRRLHGPRGVLSAQDSPSKQSKTVTFHSVPDVKEFERMSVEGSADGSFEVDHDDVDTDTDAEDWVDDQRDDGGESLDDLVRSTHRHLIITNPDTGNGVSPSLTDGFPTPHESATADFVSTLIEEGLFSPPQLGTPAFSDQPHFELPLEPEIGVDDLGQGESDNGIAPTAAGMTNFLATPSLGGSLNATPLMQAVGLPDVSDRDEVGIPYGRTHHVERSAIAHTLPPVSRVSPLEQPHLPHSDDHSMLLNGNAAQPAIPTSRSSTSDSTAPSVHQSGPLQDPFITIQTATKVLSPDKAQREEGGVPLGRTSHVERVNAARALASQSIGLGYPGMHRSPAVPKNLSQEEDRERLAAAAEMERRDSDLTPGRKIVFSSNLFDSSVNSKGKEKEDADVFGAVINTPRKVSDVNTPRKVSEVPELQGPSKRMTQFKREKETPKKEGIRQPPAPMPLDLPEPVARQEQEAESNRSSVLMNVPFSLPFIGTSPLFSNDPTFATASSASSDVDTDAEPPLTPPSTLGDARGPHRESPHRLPSFEFEDMSKGPAKSVVAPSRPAEVVVTTPVKAEFGASAVPEPTATPSSTTRVRQRISRELIRETVAQRLAEGSVRSKTSSSNLLAASSSAGSEVGAADRPTSMVEKRSASMTQPQQRPASALEARQRTPSKAEMNKALPPPPPHEAPTTPDRVSAPMSKAHTTEGALRRNRDGDGSDSSTDKPGARKRSHTFSQQRSTSGSRQRTVSGSSQTVKSASAAIQQITKDGSLDSPKSALDRLVNAFSGSGSGSGTTPAPAVEPQQQRVRIMDSPRGQTNRKETPSKNRSSQPTDVQPVSILQKPKQPTSAQGNGQEALLPPVQVGGMAEREAAINARRKENGGAEVKVRGHRRRSMSTGDVEQDEQVKKRHPRLTLGLDDDDSKSILDSFHEEVEQIQDRERGYRVREKPAVKASYMGHAGAAAAAAAAEASGGAGGREKVSAHAKAGDIDSGRAWRALRRPSDMNEHAAEIRAMRARNVSSGKATGTIFVKVLGIESLALPIPQQPTMFCITLDNGIDYIRTPYVALANGAKVNQEFALVEHPNFEFSLSLDIRRDPHILKAIHHKLNPPPAPKAPSNPSSGLRALFSSPRKPKRERAGTPGADAALSHPGPPTTPTRRTSGSSVVGGAGGSEPTIAHYITSTGSSTVGKTHVAFRPIAKQCDAKVLEIRYPMFSMFKGEPGASAPVSGARPGQRTPSGSTSAAAAAAGARKQVAKVTLQIFRLPPLPGLGPDELPGSIDECLRGIRHHAWHEHVYHEGTLTQQGGDCKHPRRRMFRLIGGSLVAMNEVTKKQVISIDLRKAISIDDLSLVDSLTTGGRSDTPTSRHTSISAVAMVRGRSDDDGVYGFSTPPRSFRIVFSDGEEIVFAADKEEDKAVWMDTLTGLVGKVPTNPLWAELLAERQRQRASGQSGQGSSGYLQVGQGHRAVSTSSSNWSLVRET